jgi:hypothetical protein
MILYLTPTCSTVYIVIRMNIYIGLILYCIHTQKLLHSVSFVLLLMNCFFITVVYSDVFIGNRSVHKAVHKNNTELSRCLEDPSQLPGEPDRTVLPGANRVLSCFPQGFPGEKSQLFPPPFSCLRTLPRLLSAKKSPSYTKIHIAPFPPNS